MQLSLILLFLISLTINVVVDGAHSRRSPFLVRNKYMDDNPTKYDRSITTFDPNGRLLQVEYSIEATKRGDTTVGAMLDPKSGIIYVAITKENNIDQPSSSSSSIHSNVVYRIDDHIFMIITGLMGDGRMLVNHLRQVAQQYYNNYDEPMTIQQAAQHLASIQHELTKTGGARPLGCTCIILGIDQQQNNRKNTIEDDDINKSTNTSSNMLKGSHLYRVDPGGIIEHCYFCCAGKCTDELMKLIYNQKLYHSELKNNENNDHSTYNNSDQDLESDMSGKNDEKRASSTTLTELLNAVHEMNSGEQPAWNQNNDKDSKLIDLWIFQPETGRRGNLNTMHISEINPKEDTEALMDMLFNESLIY